LAGSWLPDGAASGWPPCSSSLSDSFLLLVARLAIASVFFLSGRTKVSGLITVTPEAYELFRSEYALPFLSSAAPQLIATWSELLFSVLRVLGLGARLSALAFLVMTAIIEIFVYPDAWPTPLSWARRLLPLLLKGGGRWSLDSAILSARSNRHSY
jgi:putative oxidoreductase